MTPSDLLTHIGTAIAQQTSGNSAELPSRELTGEEVKRIWNDVDSIFVRATREAVAPSSFGRIKGAA